MVGKVETHVSEAKKLKVKELAELMKKKTVMVISVRGLPSAQFQDIKKKLRGRADVRVAKKSLINFALDHCGIKELHGLIEYVDDSTAMLFSDSDAFEISGLLADEKSPAKAKAGQIAPEDIEVKAGPTELLPGPDISALSAVGLAPKVENGKIAVMQDKVIVKEGSEISEAHASIMAKLDIIPFEVGVEPVAAYMDGKVYADIKIDKEGMVLELEGAFGRALPFAVEIGYPSSDTIDYLIGKAGAHEGVIKNQLLEKVEQNVEGEVAVDEVTKEEVVEEKVEEKKEDNAKEVKSEDGATLDKE